MNSIWSLTSERWEWICIGQEIKVHGQSELMRCRSNELFLGKWAKFSCRCSKTAGVLNCSPAKLGAQLAIKMGSFCSRLSQTSETNNLATLLSKGCEMRTNEPPRPMKTWKTNPFLEWHRRCHTSSGAEKFQHLSRKWYANNLFRPFELGRNAWQKAGWLVKDSLRSS